MQSIISYQNHAFYIHLDEVVSSASIHIYKDQQLEKHQRIEAGNFVKVDLPDARGRYQVRISCPNEEITKTIII